MTRTVIPARVKALLASLRTDRQIWASAPCGHEYRLADSILFYGSDFPPEARPGRDQLLDSLRLAKEEVAALRAKLTTNFAKKSLEVTIGKTVENIVPGFHDFPYRSDDCRLLFQPIDFIAFNGLGAGAITSVDFIEVKTGNSQLTKVQRQIRDAVQDHRVELRSP
jgi:hypothetical protein